MRKAVCIKYNNASHLTFTVETFRGKKTVFSQFLLPIVHGDIFSYRLVLLIDWITERADLFSEGKISIFISDSRRAWKNSQGIFPDLSVHYPRKYFLCAG